MYAIYIYGNIYHQYTPVMLAYILWVIAITCNPMHILAASGPGAAGVRSRAAAHRAAPSGASAVFSNRGQKSRDVQRNPTGWGPQSIA